MIIDIEKMVNIRYACLLIARYNEPDRTAAAVVADATAYYDFVTSIIPVPIQPVATSTKELDDEIPF